MVSAIMYDYCSFTNHNTITVHCGQQGEYVRATILCCRYVVPS